METRSYNSLLFPNPNIDISNLKTSTLKDSNSDTSYNKIRADVKNVVMDIDDIKNFLYMIAGSGEVIKNSESSKGTMINYIA